MLAAICWVIEKRRLQITLLAESVSTPTSMPFVSGIEMLARPVSNDPSR